MRPVHIFAAWALLALAGCAALQPAKTFEQKLAYAYATQAAVMTAATSSLNAHTISSSDARQVLTVADQARALLDGAKLAADGGDPTTAEGRLQLAVNLLTQLQTYLRSKGVT